MATETSNFVPTFSGLPSESLDEYIWDVETWVAGYKVEDRALLGPRLARRIGGVPGALARRELSTTDLSKPEGWKVIIEFLRKQRYGRETLDKSLLCLRRYEQLHRGRNESILDFFARENMLYADMVKVKVAPPDPQRAHNMLTRCGLTQDQINLVYSHTMRNTEGDGATMDPKQVQEAIIKFHDKSWDVHQRDATSDRWLFRRPIENNHHNHNRNTYFVDEEPDGYGYENPYYYADDCFFEEDDNECCYYEEDYEYYEEEEEDA